MENKTKDIILGILIFLIIFSLIWIVSLYIDLSMEKEKTKLLCELNQKQTNLTNDIIDMEYNCRNILAKNNPELSTIQIGKLKPINCEVFTE